MRLRRVAYALAVALAALGLLALARTTLIRQLLYPMPVVAVGQPPAPLVEVTLGAAGTPAVAWAHEVPGAGAQTAAVVFFHGNGENLETMKRARVFERMLALDVPFLVVDYPGYGRSDGRPAEVTLTAAGTAAVDWLGERYPQSPSVVVGWSLGAAVAAQTAARRDVDGVVLLEAWDRLASMVDRTAPRWAIFSDVLSDGWDSVAAAADIDAPVLLVHGSDDGIVPVALGRRLHAAFGDRAHWLEVPDTGHNDLLARRQVWDAIARFLRAVEERAASQSS